LETVVELTNSSTAASLKLSLRAAASKVRREFRGSLELGLGKFMKMAQVDSVYTP
jgi:hypothetical protein